MAVTWDIVEVESTVTTGTCNAIHWTAIDFEVVEGMTHTGRRYGVETFIADPHARGFVAFTDVTKEDCIAWVKESLGAEKVAEIETQIALDITTSKAPTLRNINPWEMGDDF